MSKLIGRACLSPSPEIWRYLGCNVVSSWRALRGGDMMEDGTKSWGGGKHENVKVVWYMNENEC